MQAIPYAALAFATLIYLFVDIYPNVRSFWGLCCTTSFWLLWFVFSVLNLIAWGVLQVAVADKAQHWVGRPELASLLLIILATLGTLTILQSFTLKAADLKLVDVGPLADRFRQAALTDASDTARNMRRKREQRLARKLAAKYVSDIPGLRAHYHTAFTFGNATSAEITKALNNLEATATGAQLSFAVLLATDIVKADAAFAKTLL